MALHFILIPFFTLIITQLIKGIIDGLQRRFSWYDFVSPGGFPSSHTAFITALAVMVGYYQGFSSSNFAIVLAVAILVIWDAKVLRIIIGKQSKEINRINRFLPAEEAYKYKVLPERIGHQTIEIFAGLVFGVLIPTLYILFFN